MFRRRERDEMLSEELTVIFYERKGEGLLLWSWRRPYQLVIDDKQNHPILLSLPSLFLFLREQGRSVGALWGPSEVPP